MSKDSFTIDNPADKGWIEDEDGRWLWAGSAYPDAEDLEVDTQHVTLDSGNRNLLPEGVNTQSDANKVILSHLDAIFDEVGEIGDLHTEGSIRASDFLDAEGNSIIGAGDVDLSSALTKDQRNDVEGTFQLIRDDSGAENTTDLLYVNGTRGTFSIGHNGSIALQGGTEIRGSSDPENGYKPYLSNFSSVQAEDGIFDKVQATDFLDADGNSIIGAGGGDPDWAVVENGSVAIGDGKFRAGDLSVALGGDAQASELAVAIGHRSQAEANTSIAIGRFSLAQELNSMALGYNAHGKYEGSIALGYNAQTSADNQFVVGPLIETVDFSNATVQAKDFLDADGNSIIGAGAGGDGELPDYPTFSGIITGSDPFVIGQAGQVGAQTGMGDDLPPFEINFDKQAVCAPYRLVAGFNGTVGGAGAAKLQVNGASYFKGNATLTGTVQATDYLDANGDSIIGSGGSSLWTEEGAESISYTGTVTVNGDLLAAKSDAGEDAFAAGKDAGGADQGANAVAIGNGAGELMQGENSIAIGYGSAYFNQGAGSISIGANSGGQNQAAGGICIGADVTINGTSLPSGKANHVIVATSTGSLTYNGADKWEFLGGPVQATDFLDADGNSIIGSGGGGDYLPATFTESYEYYDWLQNLFEPDVWVTTKVGADWLYAKSLQAKDFRATGKAIDSHAGLISRLVDGTVVAGWNFCTEQTVLGGINITALDEERPEELPFNVSDEELAEAKAKARSVQYALSVTHETLGRTVEIDKEGIIRARSFTDMDGNPIGGGGGGDSLWRFEESFESGDMHEDKYYPDLFKDAYVLSESGDASWRSDTISVGNIKGQTFGEMSYSVFHGNSLILDSGKDPGNAKSQIVNPYDSYLRRVFSVENTVFGGINILAADQERPDELPYGADEKSIQYALTVSHETLGRTVEIDKEGTIRARAFTDMDGNPIGGSGGSVWTHYPDKHRFSFYGYGGYDSSNFWTLSAETLDPYEEDGDGPANQLEEAVKLRRLEADFIDGPYLKINATELQLKYDQWDTKPKLVVQGDAYTNTATTIESVVLGGISIPASDQERPDELPYGADEKSIQYAFTVAHPTLGRTVEIDKEGIIRAREFTDMNGNPMSVSPSTMVDAFTTLQTAVADEDTLEGVKTALTNALGGLIEKFEGMKEKELSDE